MGYLIPANSKKSMLIFNAFTPKDLVVLGVGAFISLILLLVLPIDNILIALLAIGPGLIAAFLVFPVPNYHNMLVIIKEVYLFYTTRQKYVWKGWCFTDGEDKE